MPHPIMLKPAMSSYCDMESHETYGVVSFYTIIDFSLKIE